MKNSDIKKRFLSLTMAASLALSGAVLGVSNNTENVSAAKLSKSEQHDIYKKVLKKYDKAMKSNVKKFAKENSDRAVSSKYHTYYVFVDIDNNGVDECFMRYVSPGNNYTSDMYCFGETTSIYTIKDNKAVAIADKYDIPKSYDNYAEVDPIVIYKGSKYIREGGDSSSWAHLYYEYKSGVLTQNDKSFCATSSGAYVNDKKVSKSVYKKQEKKCMGTGKGYLMKKYK